MKSAPATALLLGLLAASPAAAQPADAPPAAATVDVTGRVVDAATGAPLAGATLTVEGTTRVVTADADGRFAVPGVAPGTTLIVEAKGHEAGIVIVDAADAGDLPLLPEGTSGEVIEVAGEAPPAAPGATTLDRDEVARLPGTGNDLVASLKVLPGVGAQSFPAGFDGVIIRGSSPQDSEVLVDGFKVPVLYHSIAFRSILPTEAIDSLEYLPGGFDVAYGRASSGIVSVTTRRGDAKGGGQAEASVIDAGVLGHGPAGEHGSFLVALRRSTVDFILPAIIPDDADLALTTVPRYWDGQARVDQDLGDWQLGVSAFGADDVLEGFADKHENPDQHFFSRTRFIRMIADARWTRDAWNVNLAASGMVNGFTFEFGRTIGLTVTQTVGGARAEVTRTAPSWDGLRDVVVRAGAEVEVNRDALDLATPQSPDEGQPPSMPNLDDVKNRFKGVIWVPDLAAWTAATAGFGPRVRLTTGLRVDAFTRSGDVTIQPRTELSAELGPTTTGRFAAGAYRRPAEYQDELLDDGLHPERASQVVVGVEQQTDFGLKVQASLYYTDRSALLTRGPAGKYLNQGRGTTYGGELLATYKRGPWFGWLSYSLSHSTRVDAPGARERLFDYDQPHNLNLVGSWTHGPWQLGLRFTYASGNPYTPVLGSIYDSDADFYYPIFGDVNTERVPGHHQLDARIDRSFHLGPLAMSAFLDVQNVYLNASVVGYGYNFDYSERFAFTAIPIIPSLGLRGEL